MMSKQEILDLINVAHGTSAYHKFSPFGFFPVATDGVIAVAEAAGCYWFLDIIGSYQLDKRLDPHFQVWKLVVNHDTNTAVASGYNDATLIITQEIPYTDFPLDEITMYVMDGVVLLPSER